MANANPVVMEEVTDRVELAMARLQDKRFERNWAWFEAHAPEIYASHRGKSVCISGEELFVADKAEDALHQAKAAHPADDGRFSLYIPRERMARIYANRWGVAPVFGYAGVASSEALDMSVLGRDVTNLFAVIVDWPHQVVCMLGQRHEYTITQRTP